MLDREKKLQAIGVLKYRYEFLQSKGFVMATPRHNAPDEDYIKHGAHVDGKFVLKWKCAACGKKYAANSFSVMRTHADGKCKMSDYFLKKTVQLSDPTRFVGECTCRIGAYIHLEKRIIIASEDDCPVHGFQEEDV
jgi:hypothetical protein